MIWFSELFTVVIGHRWTINRQSAAEANQAEEPNLVDLQAVDVTWIVPAYCDTHLEQRYSPMDTTTSASRSDHQRSIVNNQKNIEKQILQNAGAASPVENNVSEELIRSEYDDTFGLDYECPPSDKPIVLRKKCLLDCGKLVHPDTVQYIKRHGKDDPEKGILLYSGRFYSGEALLKLHSEGSLLSSEKIYLARVTIGQKDAIDEATSFAEAKAALMKNLKIEHVFVDEQRKECEAADQDFKTRLEEMCTVPTSDLQSTEDLLQLWIILMKKRTARTSQGILQAIKANNYISSKLKTLVNNYVEKESKFNINARFTNAVRGIFGRSEQNKLMNYFTNALANGVHAHRTKLMSKCPPSLEHKLKKVHDDHVLFVTENDMKLFSDMANALERDVVEQFVSDLAFCFFGKLEQIQEDHLRGVIPLTNPIYFFLCKSLLEVAGEIRAETNVDKLLDFNGQEWKISHLPSGYSRSALVNCLWRQLTMLLSLVNHYQPGKYVANRCFRYKFRIFQKADLQQISSQTRPLFRNDWGDEATNDSIPHELHVWMCLLDDTIAHMCSDDSGISNMFTCLLKLYIDYILSSNFNKSSLESMRMVTHNTIRFLAQAGAFIGSQGTLDSDILRKQFQFMNLAIADNRMAVDEYRDVIEVFTVYWKRRGDVISNLPNKLPGGCFKADFEEVQNMLLQCMCKALDKKVSSTTVIDFCRTFDEFLVDLNELSFEWFVRIQERQQVGLFTARNTLEIVNNKWKDGERRCYQVSDFQKFVKLYQALHDEENLPRHYQIDVIKMFLEYINGLASKEDWNGTDPLTANNQIRAMLLLTSAMRTSLLYLKEQADYICFDRFLEESTKPFSSVINESTSFNDFRKRVNLIKESFWFIRNLNAIDVDTALELCKSINAPDSFSRDHLRAGFYKYSNQFERYMKDVAGMTCEEKVSKIVADVKRQVEPKLTSEWTFEYKQNKLPIIIAGLGAVWSIQASKDVASTGQYLKPHCIQIICVLRLLSADKQSMGVGKHLAQVLTGQGKSLVLGLIASVLALLGHQVHIMCYSEYLAKRDASYFMEMYRLFSIQNMVLYKTFAAVANDEISKSFTVAQEYLSQCMGTANNSKVNRNTEDNTQSISTVLLIDEVDVFFTDTFYGNTSDFVHVPEVKGLGLIQAKIWEFVTQGKSVSEVKQLILEFKDKSVQPLITNELNVFLNKPGSYSILEKSQNVLTEKTYTNKSLYLYHLDRMITTAIDVFKGSDEGEVNKCFKINDYGIIIYRDNGGKYRTGIFYGYYNTFNYFRLKQTDFLQLVSNYGYLHMTLGSISFAKLPENYPLILGVTGTLTTLNNYERSAVEEHYEIRNSTITPSFFGFSNLKFNTTENFQCLEGPTDWRNQIFARINAVINENRAVLVFFNTDDSIDKFNLEFASHFSRLNVLTMNTYVTKMERYIEDAGVAKTVTLATREMGRGVDYKSSVSVEKNGGIHVIQTFFSMDVKEETQIKGRTARKDNRGSYELIVLLPDLKELGLVSAEATCDGISYHQLEKYRSNLTRKADATKAQKLREAEAKHCMTVDFYKKVALSGSSLEGDGNRGKMSTENVGSSVEEKLDDNYSVKCYEVLNMKSS